MPVFCHKLGSRWSPADLPFRRLLSLTSPLGVCHPTTGHAAPQGPAHTGSRSLHCGSPPGRRRLRVAPTLAGGSAVPPPPKVCWHPSPGALSHPPNVWPGPTAAPAGTGDHSTNTSGPPSPAPPAAPAGRQDPLSLLSSAGPAGHRDQATPRGAGLLVSAAWGRHRPLPLLLKVRPAPPGRSVGFRPRLVGARHLTSS
ncbi:hypothetical protein NDU88_004446 [Pleurodeles waltl]|uniref:Uncharacterized protein n=1 Tax=Pleurodeles waltl TaxID=8319 RepID=A0AAV7VKD1_PLEWA|nr:hypothetical protein NDU88_004446 [Pleurodeles waltl]